MTVLSRSARGAAIVELFPCLIFPYRRLPHLGQNGSRPIGTGRVSKTVVQTRFGGEERNMKSEDIQESRIRTVVGDEDELDFEEAVGRFYDHLKKNLRFPFEVSGIEDFRWEEFYVCGPGDAQEYKRLKKTQPSYEDRYDL